MKNFATIIENLSARHFDVTTTSAGVTQVQQTQRNGLKSELVGQLAQSLATLFEGTEVQVRRFDGGVGIEIPNEMLADSGAGSGALTLALDLKVMSLDTDLAFEGDEWETAQAEKRAKAEENAREKAARIERTKAQRAERAKAKAVKA